MNKTETEVRHFLKLTAPKEILTTISIEKFEHRQLKFYAFDLLKGAEFKPTTNWLFRYGRTEECFRISTKSLGFIKTSENKPLGVEILQAMDADTDNELFETIEGIKNMPTIFFVSSIKESVTSDGHTVYPSHCYKAFSDDKRSMKEKWNDKDWLKTLIGTPLAKDKKDAEPFKVVSLDIYNESKHRSLLKV
jgi:hypothetical protein